MLEDTEEAPPEVHHYSDIGEVPWDIQKYVSFIAASREFIANNNSSYFAQRYKLFSKYDEGVWLTDDAWFGVTPEPIAKYAHSSYDSSYRGTDQSITAK